MRSEAREALRGEGMSALPSRSCETTDSVGYYAVQSAQKINRVTRRTKFVTHLAHFVRYAREVRYFARKVRYFACEVRYLTRAEILL